MISSAAVLYSWNAYRCKRKKKKKNLINFKAGAYIEPRKIETGKYSMSDIKKKKFAKRVEPIIAAEQYYLVEKV